MQMQLLFAKSLVKNVFVLKVLYFDDLRGKNGDQIILN